MFPQFHMFIVISKYNIRQEKIKFWSSTAYSQVAKQENDSKILHVKYIYALFHQNAQNEN